MDISIEERTMYRIMKAIYESGIPISFKGSMVLKALLIESGYSENTRHTVDIDGNWFSSTAPSLEMIRKSLQKAVDKADIPLNAVVYREYGEHQSAGIRFLRKGKGDILFRMDLDVNKPYRESKIYHIENITFSGLTPNNILADKISVASSEKIFRRIKDLIDLYYLSHVIGYDYTEIVKIIEASGRQLGDFDGLLNRKDDLAHSYDKFKFEGGVDKPPFNDIYDAVRNYLKPFLP